MSTYHLYFTDVDEYGNPINGDQHVEVETLAKAVQLCKDFDSRGELFDMDNGARKVAIIQANGDYRWL